MRHHKNFNDTLLLGGKVMKSYKLRGGCLNAFCVVYLKKKILRRMFSSYIILFPFNRSHIE